MRTRLTALLMGLLLTAGLSVYADQTITVTANDSDISANLDLKAVATIFGEAKDLEQFEEELNNPEARISNLDLNGDGEVDYIRVIETEQDNNHLVVLQAVLAKDIYQDVASIYVEKDPATQQVTVQIVGDDYIYGPNYVIEPVYVTVPVIYDWFWGTHWVAWHSPYYWGYYPHYWHPYHCWAVHDYWHHIYDFHHYHPYCSYRYRPAPPPHYHDMPRPQSRRDYATRHPEGSFTSRNAGRQVSNARDLQPMRSARTADATRGTVSSSRGSRTFDSQNVRPSATRVNGASATTSRSTAASPARSASATRSNTATTTRSASSSTSRSSAAPAQRSSTTQRATSTSSTSRSTAPSRSSSVSSSTSRSSSVSRSSSTPQRSSSSSSVRSSSSTSRSSSSSVSRSSSYGGSRGSAPSSGASRSSSSGTSRSSSTRR